MKLIGPYLLGATLAAWTLAAEQTSLLQDFECIHPPYAIHLLSLDPLVIYIADFITSFEREHLLQTRYACSRTLLFRY
jgi:hypothetical protein